MIVTLESAEAKEAKPTRRAMRDRGASTREVSAVAKAEVSETAPATKRSRKPDSTKLDTQAVEGDTGREQLAVAKPETADAPGPKRSRKRASNSAEATEMATPEAVESAGRSSKRRKAAAVVEKTGSASRPSTDSADVGNEAAQIETGRRSRRNVAADVPSLPDSEAPHVELTGATKRGGRPSKKVKTAEDPVPQASPQKRTTRSKKSAETEVAKPLRTARGSKKSDSTEEAPLATPEPEQTGGASKRTVSSKRAAQGKSSRENL